MYADDFLLQPRLARPAVFLNVEDAMELQNISTWKEVKVAVVHTTQAIAITNVMMFI